MINRIIANQGSIQNINAIPKNMKILYKTVWEIKQRALIDMAADRGPFIDQSQSLNVFMEQPSNAKMSSMHFHAWQKGLKTGMYYLRTQSAADAIQFTVDQNMLSSQEVTNIGKKSEVVVAPTTEVVCVLRKPGMSTEEDCLVCGS